MQKTIRTILSLILIFTFILPVQPAQAEQSSLQALYNSLADSSGATRVQIRWSSDYQAKRLEELGMNLLAQGEGWALALVTDDQLETLARLRFEIGAADQLGLLLAEGAASSPRFAQTMQTAAKELAGLEAMDPDGADLEAAQLALIRALTPDQAALTTEVSSIDDDADGLTNTQEGWWCTDPQVPDSDSDGTSDGVEVQALKDWVANRRAGPPGGTPWPAWPFNDTTCPDKDHDSIPNLAERWELGLNMDWESTDHDKFDDGQEVFGVTYCPGGDLSCGYGELPSSQDSGFIGHEIPGWVKSPGNHPFVAGFPLPEIDVVPSSLRVQTINVVTTDHVISSGTEKSYTTAKTEGTSTSVANTVTWNEWQEVSESLQERILSALPLSISSTSSDWFSDWKKNFINSQNYIRAQAIAQAGCGTVTNSSEVGGELGLKPLGIGGSVSGNIGNEYGLDSEYTGAKCRGALRKAREISAQFANDFPDEQNTYTPTNIRFDPVNNINIENDIVLSNSFDAGEIASGLGGIQFAFTQAGQILGQRLFEIGSILAAPTRTTTETSGKSWGGAQTTTNEQYEEHTITNGEAFSNEDSWGIATAIDSSHTADLRFSYTVRNEGTEYAHQICNLTFNIYIGDDPNPATTYFVGPDLGGTECFANFMPDEEHTYTSQAIPLSLEQMKTIDLGGTLRITVEDYTYGSDELYYQNAASSGILLAMEDGTDDGNEAIDAYLIPTWGEETVLDVLARYFPHTLDENDGLTAIWTPEQRADTPAWCASPQRYGNTLWCKHALSTADWWNIYTNGMGDGTEGFQDTLAVPGQTALFRFNKDSDLDGYSDRSEARLGTDDSDAGDFPHPELLAGVYSTPSGNDVTATLSLLNTGLYDAYGVEAVMIAPDDSITIANNTVGGSGRVRAQRAVVVGSQIKLQSPLPAAWLGAGHAVPSTNGYYSGTVDRNYTFTVSCGTTGGCDVGAGAWTLNWVDGQGGSGSLSFGAGYLSPNPLAVGAYGVQLSLLTGKVYNGESFSLAATKPRDTFQYTINSTPYTSPVVIVSYNDPQGNHRFILPPAAMNLANPNDDLSAFAGEMLRDPGVEIITTAGFAPGSNITGLLVNNPSGVALADSHLFLEFIDLEGNVVLEKSATQTLLEGPSNINITWDTAEFDPAFNPDQDYIVMAFWTDLQGNILDTAGRPLSSFQDDPSPVSDILSEDETWNFGLAQQGTLMQRQFTLASVGYMDLLTYMGEYEGITVDGPASAPVAPADTAVYTMTINTQYLPVGPFLETIPVRTSDPAHPERTITIQGEITAMAEDGIGGDVIRPLDWTAYIDGMHSQGEWVEFSHTLGPDPQSLHPVKVFSQDRATWWGVGKYATDFGQGTASADMFGNGQDGDRVITSGQTAYTDDIQRSLTLNAFSDQVVLSLNSVQNLNVGDEVLVMQIQGTTAGFYELHRIASISGNQITLQTPLTNSYLIVGDSKAIAARVPNYQNLTINTGGTLTSYSWNGITGGVVAFRVKDSLVVQSGGKIDVSGKGFRGGIMPDSGWTSNGNTGESQLRASVISSAVANGGGGGGGCDYQNSGGSGGSFGSEGSNGGGNQCANNHKMGYMYGEPLLNNIFLGSGGGSAGGCCADGGAGGGVVLLFARNMNLAGTITSNGANGQGGGSNPGGAGGAGGTIKIVGANLTLGINLTTALGGTGGSSTGMYGGQYTSGGYGGTGRIRVEYCDSVTGATNPAASTQKLECFIAEQVETNPYVSARLRLPEAVTGGRAYQVEYGRRFVFPSLGQQTQSIRVPKQIYAAAGLQALVSNADTPSGILTLQMDIGNNASYDWVYNQTTNFPVSLDVTDIVDALNAYLVSRTDIAWGNDVDVPFRLDINRKADVILTNLQLSLQFNQPEFGMLAPVEAGADRPLDWPVYVPGSHNQGEWIEFTHTLGPDAQTIHPVSVYSQDYATLWGVGQYATEYGQGTAPYDMFGNGQDGPLVISANTTFNAINSSAYGTENTTVLYATNSSFQAGQKILIHQSRGTNAGAWEINQIASYTPGTITTSQPLKKTYIDSGASQAQVLVLRQYTDITVNAGVTWTVNAWNGNVGGILAFLCQGTTNILGNIVADGGSGYGTNTTGQGYGVGGGFLGGGVFRRGPGTSFQGEGTGGSSIQSTAANGNGAGGSTQNPANNAGGTGGSNGSQGTQGQIGSGVSGTPGTTSGNEELTSITFGGGGSGGSAENNNSDQLFAGGGGSGGGIVIIKSESVLISGKISANGGLGGGGAGASGGGGAGGSIYVAGVNLALGSTLTQATGGIGGKTGIAFGGDGGFGRIRFEYCESMTGTSNPATSTQKLQCFIAEQVNSLPYSNTRLNLPETFSDGRTYQVQFGRRFVFPATGEQTSSLRMTRQLYGTASIDALVSNTNAASGPLDLCLDFGNDGTCDFIHDQTTTFPATIPASGFAAALNSYMLSQNQIAWGDPIDVPVRVSIDREAQVMLTNLALTPSGAKTRFLRLPARSYSDVRVEFRLLQPGVPSGPLSFTVDVGADGSVDWPYAGTTSFPAEIVTDDLSDAVNAYLAGRTDVVDVPLRIIPSPFLDTYLESATATPSNRPDLTLGAADIGFSPADPMESDLVTIQATIYNNGGLESRPAVAAFFAQAPGWGDWYLGSRLVPVIPAGESTPISLPWDTTGFYGDLPVKVVLDPYDRIDETGETNNLAEKNINIRTRPDLAIAGLNQPEVDLVDTVPASIPLRLDNLGQTNAADSVVALYDGNPQEGGALIGEVTLPATAGSQTALSFEWTPSGVGAHRLFAIADRDEAVNEANRGNNLAWVDVVVGLKSPVLLDSGATGADPAYNPAFGYGYIDEELPDVLSACGGGDTPEETLRRDPYGRVLYKFDHLVPSHYYHLDVVLYECDGAGRQENVVVDGYTVAGPEDLGDGNVHRLSLLIDPALYVDRSLDIAIEASGINGAVVGAVNLHDVDYRYVDAGNIDSDLAFSEVRGFGWTDPTSIANVAWGRLPSQSLRIDQTDANLTYRFDRLKADSKYKVHLTFWQKEGAPILQKVFIDGIDTNLSVNSSDYLIHRETVDVPENTYSTDGWMEVTIQRLGANGAMVNEISLEEETLALTDAQVVTPTPHFSDVFGDVKINVTSESTGVPAPVGTLVQAYDPRGVLVGAFSVTTAGTYGYLRIYGEDATSTPPIPGIRASELVSFKINGAPAVAKPSFYWQDDHLVHRVDLFAGEINQQSILLAAGWNYISFYYEPPSPLLTNVLQSIYNRYDRVLSEQGVFATELPPEFVTLRELHPGQSYFIRTTGTTSVNLLVDGIHQPADTPLQLHQGWNWIGYMPSFPLPVGEALQSIAGKFQLVHSLYSVYNPADPEHSTLHTMSPGEGYMIYMDEAAVLTYPSTAPENLAAVATPTTPLSALGVAATPDFMTVYGSLLINGEPAPVGTVVQILTPDGVVAGAAFTERRGILAYTHVFGDPRGSAGSFQPGEPLTFRVNGLPAEADVQLTWGRNEMFYQVNLASTQKNIFLPLISKY